MKSCTGGPSRYDDYVKGTSDVNAAQIVMRRFFNTTKQPMAAVWFTLVCFLAWCLASSWSSRCSSKDLTSDTAPLPSSVVCCKSFPAGDTDVAGSHGLLEGVFALFD